MVLSLALSIIFCICGITFLAHILLNCFLTDNKFLSVILLISRDLNVDLIIIIRLLTISCLSLLDILFKLFKLITILYIAVTFSFDKNSVE